MHIASEHIFAKHMFANMRSVQIAQLYHSRFVQFYSNICSVHIAQKTAFTNSFFLLALYLDPCYNISRIRSRYFGNRTYVRFLRLVKMHKKVVSWLYILVILHICKFHKNYTLKSQFFSYYYILQFPSIHDILYT